MQPDDAIRDAAALWAVKTGDPAFAEWDAFTLWLEEHRAHAAAYDAAIMAADDAAAVLAAPPLAANDEGLDDARLTRRWAMPAIAAALVAVLAVGTWQARDPSQTFATAPGETRSIALTDGSMVELAGGSRLTIDDKGSRHATLEEGRALFTIRHDESDPFVLVAGRDTLVDAGTVFDVAMGEGGLSVEVGEGAVVVNPATVAIRLDPGQRAVRRGGDWQVGRVPEDSVGEWRQGRITFRAASLPEIADQLTRATGVAYSAASRGGALSGSVAVETLRADPASLGPLLGVTVRHEGDKWVIASP